VIARVICGRESSPVTFVRSTSCAKNTLRRALEVKGGASQTYAVDKTKTKKMAKVRKR
jgi:hypothetical protein